MVHRILFICHGNICRSVMAQCILQHLVEQRGAAKEFLIDSCATSREAIGNPIYPPARAKLEAEGIPVLPHRARQITQADYDNYDVLLLMDQNNRRNLRRILPEDPQKKVHLLLSLAGSNRDIADPWYTGDFDQTFDDITAGCLALLEQIKHT